MEQPIFHFEFEGLEELCQGLEKLGRESLDVLERALDVAGRTQVGRFRQEQLSGRTGGDMGLNKVTGNLHESPRDVTIVQEHLLVSEIYNRGAQYWEVHQAGRGVKKRLRLEEDLEQRGAPLYVSEIELGLNNLLERGK